jgi:hypothetical protein
MLIEQIVNQVRGQFGKRRVADVEAAVRIRADALAGSGSLIHAVVILQLHPDIASNELMDTRWRARAYSACPRNQA